MAFLGVAAFLCLCTLVCTSSGETRTGYFLSSPTATDSSLLAVEKDVTAVDGNFIIQNSNNLQSLTAFPSLVNITGYIYISKNNNIENMTFQSLTNIPGGMELNRNTGLITANFPNLTNIGRLWIHGNTALEALHLGSLSVVDGFFYIIDQTALVNITGCERLEITKLFRFDNNDALKNLTGFDSLLQTKDSLEITNNDALEEINLPSVVNIDWNLEIKNNSMLENLDFKNLDNVCRNFEIAENPLLTTTIIDNAFPNIKTIGGDVLCGDCPQRIKNLANTGPCGSPPPEPKIDTTSPTSGFGSGSESISKRGSMSMSKSGSMSMSKSGSMSKSKSGSMSKSKSGSMSKAKAKNSSNSSLQSYVRGSSASIGASLVGFAVLVAVVAVVAYKRQQKNAGFTMVTSTTVEFPSEMTPLV